jgi:Phospholipase_D-nuclease N-terminal/Short C-terminal domain
MVRDLMLTLASYSFGDALLTVLEVALFVAWLCLLFYVFADIFRSHDLSGWAKALWCLFIIIIPWLGSLIYIIARGNGIHERSVAQQKASEDAFRTYIRQTAGTQSSASIDELERLSNLHKQGSLSDEEFEKAKSALLAAQQPQ